MLGMLYRYQSIGYVFLLHGRGNPCGVVGPLDLSSSQGTGAEFGLRSPPASRQRRELFIIPLAYLVKILHEHIKLGHSAKDD